MFEKEAEERARKLEENQTLGIYDNEEEYARDSGWNAGEVAGYEEGFQDGAEFGFQKGIKARINTTTISDCPIKDEWHYVKDELPSENAMLLLARKTINGVQALIGYYRSNQFEIFNEKSCLMQNIDSVYAWKEIVLPKLPKEGE